MPDDKTKGGAPQIKAAKPQMGITVTGIYTGTGTQVLGAQGRRVSGVMIALPYPSGTLELGCPESAVKAVDDEYSIGDVITAVVARPRGYKDRIYWQAISVGNIVCG